LDFTIIFALNPAFVIELLRTSTLMLRDFRK
jgi:hypothetical protein